MYISLSTWHVLYIEVFTRVEFLWVLQSPQPRTFLCSQHHGLGRWCHIVCKVIWSLVLLKKKCWRLAICTWMAFCVAPGFTDHTIAKLYSLLKWKLQNCRNFHSGDACHVRLVVGSCSGRCFAYNQPAQICTCVSTRLTHPPNLKSLIYHLFVWIFGDFSFWSGDSEILYIAPTFELHSETSQSNIFKPTSLHFFQDYLQGPKDSGLGNVGNHFGSPIKMPWDFPTFFFFGSLDRKLTVFSCLEMKKHRFHLHGDWAVYQKSINGCCS